MNHWPFILAAYGLTVLGTAGLLINSYTAMRRSENKVRNLGREQ